MGRRQLAQNVRPVVICRLYTSTKGWVVSKPRSGENMPVGGIDLDLILYGLPTRGRTHAQFALSICPVKLVRHRNANRFGKDCGKGKKAAR